MKYLKEKGVDTNQLFREIKDLARTVLASIHPFLVFESDCQFQNPSKKVKCFQIIGLDMMFDHTLKPWLLEINGNPSLNMDHLVKKDNK
jgi:hypothetical protein